jgi:hypothetical protein
VAIRGDNEEAKDQGFREMQLYAGPRRYRETLEMLQVVPGVAHFPVVSLPQIIMAQPRFQQRVDWAE